MITNIFEFQKLHFFAIPITYFSSSSPKFYFLLTDEVVRKSCKLKKKSKVEMKIKRVMLIDIDHSV